MLEQFVAVMPGTIGPRITGDVPERDARGRRRARQARQRALASHRPDRWPDRRHRVASLRASAVINQRTFVNYPVLWCAIIADILAIIVVVFARRITTNWQRHKAIMHIANAIAAIDIALTLFYALPDVILQLTIWVEPGDPIFTSDMLLRALGFALGLAMSIIVAAIFRTLRSTAVRASFTAAVLAVMVILFIQHLTGVMQILQARGFPIGPHGLRGPRMVDQPQQLDDHGAGIRVPDSGRRLRGGRLPHAADRCERSHRTQTQGIPPPCRGLRRMEPRGDDWCHADPHRRRRRNPADHHPFATGGLLTQGRRGHHPIQPS